MELNTIKPAAGAKMARKRVGRGGGSGLGKTAGRGHKGQKARAGSHRMRPGFEGGQMPLYMRLPKRGFNNIFARDFAEVNLGRIQQAIDSKKLDTKGKITEEALRKAGLARRSRDGIRLLGNGEITAKVEIEVAGASKSAAAAVEKAGGTLTLTYKKKVTANKKGEPGKRQQRRAKASEKRAARGAATA